MNTPSINNITPSPEIDPEQDRVGIAVFSAFNDATPLAARMLCVCVEREFERARVSFTAGEFAGEDFVAVFCQVPMKLPALEILQAMADRMKVVGGLKVGWFDRTEGVWREYYLKGLYNSRPFESLETHIGAFCQRLAERTKTLAALTRAAKGEGAQPEG